jgi:hypothetical protein
MTQLQKTRFCRVKHVNLTDDLLRQNADTEHHWKYLRNQFDTVFSVVTCTLQILPNGTYI